MCFIVHHVTTDFPLFYQQLHLGDSWSQGNNIYIASGKTTKHDIGNNEIRDVGGRDCWGLKKSRVAMTNEMMNVKNFSSKSKISRINSSSWEQTLI